MEEQKAPRSTERVGKRGRYVTKAVAYTPEQKAFMQKTKLFIKRHPIVEWEGKMVATKTLETDQLIKLVNDDLKQRAKNKHAQLFNAKIAKHGKFAPRMGHKR